MIKLPCNDPQHRAELFVKILFFNTDYRREIIDKAIDSCCIENNPDIESCSMERARIFYLEEKSGKN